MCKSVKCERVRPQKNIKKKKNDKIINQRVNYDLQGVCMFMLHGSMVYKTNKRKPFVDVDGATLKLFAKRRCGIGGVGPSP